MSGSLHQSAQEILELLRSSQSTLATAESITGGLISGAMTEIPGSSDVFLGGVVAYSVAAKSSLLRVDHELITKHGVVSAEVASAMAHGALDAFGSSWAIATTGVAGPGASEGVAAGTVWIAVAHRGGAPESELLSLSGDRQEVRGETIARAFALFTRILRG
ncbi:MAG: CinA family protein [Actinobacteria bacterium]|uniref:CinA family protein n=1 Tax=Candidatus Fonsibacter lacus TaxID=2576439 RepID=A0A965LKY1_9PROT|nr:CinA family protein [Candidatus Fonsibacter lacus]